MIEVYPAILSSNYEEMKNTIEMVAPFCNMVQIDFCDGKFVPSRTWPYDKGDNFTADRHFNAIINEQEGMPMWEDVDVELHLMVANAHHDFETFLKLGPKKVLFQLEAECTDSSTGSESQVQFLDFIKNIDAFTHEHVQIGIAINPTTPIENIVPFIQHIDYVQCMGIEHIGSQGQPFFEGVFSHISYLQDNYPDLLIAVDGCVNTETAPRLVDAGVHRLVIGSALLRATDVEETYKWFQNLA